MYRKIISRLPRRAYDNWVWWALIVMIVAIVILGSVLFMQVVLRVRGNWPEGNRATLSPVPGVRISPVQGRPGEPITITGSGWPVGEVVVLRLAAPPGYDLPAVELLTTTVGAGGTFSSVVSVPVIPPWSQLPAVQVQAVGRASATTVTAVFGLGVPATATPVVLSSPTPSAVPTQFPTPASTPAPTAVVSTWRGEYYNNTTLHGRPSFIREDADLNFEWGKGLPAPGILADGFSVRWERTASFSGGTYRFYATADDGVRVWLDGQLLIDEWHAARSVVYTADRTLLAGDHRLVVEYYEVSNNANVRVWWDQPSLYPQWRGEYFDTLNLSESDAPVLTRNDAVLDFDWGAGAAAPGVPADKFSVRWTRTLGFEAGTYRFRALVDDGARLYVDGARVIDAWTNGSVREVTGEATLAEGDHVLRLEYYDAGGEALVQLSWERIEAYPDWKGMYWRNASLSGLPALVRNDSRIEFNWHDGSPAVEIPKDHFSARWTRTAAFEAGTYHFTVRMDDGARLWVDDQLVIDAWQDGAARQVSARLPLTAGSHTLRLDYYEGLGQASISLNWELIPTTFEGWRGEYWSNATLSGEPRLIRDDAEIAFDWGKGAPAVGLPEDNFSARWQRTVTLAAGVYRFNATADDGVRVYVDGARGETGGLVIDEWHTSAGVTLYSVDLSLAQGEHEIAVEYYEGASDAAIRVWFERVGDLPTQTPTAGPTSTPDTATSTPTPTPMSTSTPVPDTATPPPTQSWTPTVTSSPVATPLPTQSPTLTSTISPTSTPTQLPTETPLPTQLPTETPTPTQSQTPTPTPTLAPVINMLRINEVMPVVGEVDWNDDGDVDEDDAWVELYNPTDEPFDLSWWVLEVKGINQYGYTFPVATVLDPDTYLVVFSGQTDFGLTEGSLRLREGAIVYEEMPLRPLTADLSFCRDAWGYWRADWVPTPGSLNLPPAASGRAR